MTRSDRLALAIEAGDLALPAEGRVVVLRALPRPSLALIPRDRLLCEQGFKPLHDALAAAGRTVTTRAEGPAAMAIVDLTRSRAETMGNIARALRMVAPGGTVLADGAKSDGVDSIARQVGRAIPLAGAFVKAHGRCFWLVRPEDLPEEVATWARAAEPARNSDGFLTAPGMFSPDHADPGSRRLAEALDGGLAGSVADLGAGWGWLAREVLSGSPRITALDLYEADRGALDAARSNVEDPRAGFHWADATRPVPGARYDAVISNPPFHQDRAADPGIGAAFIRAAAAILKPAGSFTLVANRQLPYESTLDAAFRHWEKLGEDGAYKVLRAERPRPA